MRIVFLSPTGELGGAERALLDLLAGLRDAQPSWVLHLVAASAGPLAAGAGGYGVPTVVLPFPRSLARVGEWGRRRGPFDRAVLVAGLCRAAIPAAGYAGRLRRLLADLRPDILHTNGLKMHLLGAWARSPGTAVVWHLHDYPSARALTARLLRGHVRRCAGIVTNSASVAADARSVFGDRVRIDPVPNAVDLDRFSPDGPVLDLDRLAALPPAAPGVVRVGLVATFARWKGHLTFLSALARLSPDARVRAYVIGGPLYHTDRSQFSAEELRGAAAALGLSDRVGFTGPVPDTAPAYRALDVVVHASTEPEPFGLVIAEAMACGRPVVTTAAGGAAELATGAFHALVFPPGDAGALADRIAQLAADPGLRQRLGAAGRDLAVERFARLRMARALVPIYEALAPAD